MKFTGIGGLIEGENVRLIIEENDYTEPLKVGDVIEISTTFYNGTTKVLSIIEPKSSSMVPVYDIELDLPFDPVAGIDGSGGTVEIIGSSKKGKAAIIIGSIAGAITIGLIITLVVLKNKSKK